MVAGEQNIPASPAMSQVAGGQGQPATAIRSPHGPAGAMAGGHMHSLAEMKDAADRQAAPLKEKLKSDPKNTSVLLQLGAIYHATHQFKDAADYYGRAVQTDPKNVATRTKLATSLFRSGDADGAIAQLNQALTYEPKDVNCLYDLGMIRLQGKQDGKGAVAAWQRLLKSNPQLPADRKDAVLKQMADVMTTLDNQHGLQGAQK
jgi:cytochrome c-type biogenesis protein CcmH/NrfG